MTIPTLTFIPALAAFSQFLAKPPAFEVASVKPNTSGSLKQGKGRFLPGGRVEFPNGTVKHFIMAAFQVQSDMIAGGPAWLDSDRYDVVATAPPDTDEKTLRIMLQTFLAERFRLVIHRKERATLEYALLVGKSGLKLAISPVPGKRNCTWQDGGDGLRRRICHNMTMAELASALPGWGGIGTDRPVVDLTGLKNAYDFHFEIGQAKKGAAAEKDDPGPTIFDAMAQLGLKLEPRKGSVPIIVIDHVERVPTEN